MVNNTNTSGLVNDELKGAETPLIEKMILTTVLGQKVDISQMFLSMVLYEDIFAPCLSGEISFLDSLGLFDKLPICGEEKLTIKFFSYNYSTENDPINFIHRTFDILGVKDVKQDKDYTKSYTLIFASPELKKNESIRISKGYQQKRISDVVTTILTNDYEDENPTGLGFPTNSNILDTENLLKQWRLSPYLYTAFIEANYRKIDEDDSVELLIEKTKYTEPWISLPYAKPFDIIKWLSTRSIREAPGRYGSTSPNFMFFENKRGYNFLSLDSLLENKEYNVTHFNFSTLGQNIGSETDRRVVNTERIVKLEYQDCYNILDNIRNGVYASRLYTYDFYTGEQKTYDFGYMDGFDTQENTQTNEKLKVYPPFLLDKEGKSELTTKYNSRRLFVGENPSKYLNTVTSEQSQRYNEIRPQVGSNEYLQKRLSQLHSLGNFKIIVEVGGNTKHKVGDCVSVTLPDLIPSNTPELYTPIPSKYYSGNYLITSIKHVLSKTSYNMIMELVIDAYTAKIGEL